MRSVTEHRHASVVPFGTDGSVVKTPQGAIVDRSQNVTNLRSPSVELPACLGDVTFLGPRPPDIRATARGLTAPLPA